MVSTRNAGPNCPHPEPAQVRLEIAGKPEAYCQACGLVFPLQKQAQ